MLNKFKMILLGGLLWCSASYARPHFEIATPDFSIQSRINGAALCATAKQTLDYLNKGEQYDPLVIHAGVVHPIPLSRVKATLRFICQHQDQLNDPVFLKQHFDFVRWSPDIQYAKQFSKNKPLLKNLPHDQILMTKYYVHLANASKLPRSNRPYAIYALPEEEKKLTIEQANAMPNLIRFQYGKQAILAGALKNKPVPALAYVSRDDLESALMQGTIVANMGGANRVKIFNVNRNNNIQYNRLKQPFDQERYWYFKEVEGIKGYGKDSEYKITVNPEVTFAGDLAQLGLGKVLMIQYPEKSGHHLTQIGVLADTGGAFENNLYQVDYLAGLYHGKADFTQSTRHLPDYVTAYFMVLKTSV